MPITAPLNPRVVPGSNVVPNYAQEVLGRLSSEYAEIIRSKDELVILARKAPPPISDENCLARGAIIKRVRDLDHRVEAVRKLEKEPYLRGGDAVDSFFFAVRDELGKRNPRDRSVKPGIADVLQAGNDDWQNEKIAKERARLEKELLEQEEIARKARLAAEAAAAEAIEAEARAARARLPHTQEAKLEAAHEARTESVEAQITALHEAQKAEEAFANTFTRSADLSRVRGTDESGAGVMLTTGQVGYATLVDRNQIDLEKLRPYFTDAEIEKALRGYAKATDYKVQLPGALIGKKNKGITR